MPLLLLIEPGDAKYLRFDLGCVVIGFTIWSGEIFWIGGLMGIC